MEQGTVYEGSCLCGAVRFEAAVEPRELINCHCRMCQKAHGGPVATFIVVRHDQFRFTDGEDCVTSYPSSPEARRTFCSQCGSALQFVREGRDTFGLAVAPIDTPLDVLPVRDLYTDTMVHWLA